MNKVLATVTMMAVLAVAGMAEASLSTVGTADYAGSSYNLIYDKDSSLIWLDYSNAGNTWNNQVAWASSLGTTISNVKLSSGYSGINWNGNWRLPTTVDGPYVYGTNGTTTAGYNITSSEFGHLFYTELGNKMIFDANGSFLSGTRLANKGPFANLHASWYWSNTSFAAYPFSAWYFDTQNGIVQLQSTPLLLDGMAVISAQVVEATPTPIPAAAWLFGSGLMSLAGLRRRIKQSL